MDGWTPDEIDQLICLVRDNEILYDQSLPGYSNRDTVGLVWRAIARKFENKKDSKACSKKWQVLRAGFRKRRHEYLPSGSGGCRNRKWPYFDALSFLDIHMNDRNTFTNAPESCMSQQSVDTDPETTPGPSTSNMDFFDHTIEDEELEISSQVDEDTDYKTSIPVRCDKGREKVDAAVIKYLKEKSEKKANKTSMQLFLESVAEEANQLARADQMEFRLLILNFLKDKLNM